MANEGKRSPEIVTEMAATSNFLVPAPMDLKGDLGQNWSFFKAQYENYEVATSLNKKQDDIRVETLLSLMGKEGFVFIHTWISLRRIERKSTKFCKHLRVTLSQLEM